MTSRTRRLLGTLILATYTFWILTYSVTSQAIPVVEPIVELKTEIPVPEVKAQINDYERIRLRRVTAYNPLSWQTDSTPNISSCGPNRPNQIAVSRDLFFDEYGRKHLCGVEATLITDRGEVFNNVVIYDTMNARYRQTADIYMEDLTEARAFGRTSGVLIIKTF